MTSEKPTTTSGSTVEQLVTVRQRLQQHGWLDGMTPDVMLCKCEHKLQGTGAVFYQSLELLNCQRCQGWQVIRKPVEF